jgi:hypothetical protein
VPAKQRCRRDDERLPVRARQQPTSSGEEDSIGGPQLRPSDLSTQHRELVAEHHDLQLLELVRAKAQRRELQNASKYEVTERPDQEPAPSGRRDGRTTLRSRMGGRTRNPVNAPHTLTSEGVDATEPPDPPTHEWAPNTSRRSFSPQSSEDTPERPNRIVPPEAARHKQRMGRVAIMDVGEPERSFTVEPLDDPVPRELPLPETPAEEPAEHPAEPVTA